MLTGQLPEQALCSVENLPHVSVVVIGKNEAANLKACFQSIRAMDYPQDRIELIYVDTGSTDGSVQIAQQERIRTFEEKSANPTPGLARNRGLREAQYNIIHFVDGDMTVAPSYLKCAVQHLAKENVVCVFGRLVEKQESINPISWILHYDWIRKQPGTATAPGGGGTFLKSALLEVGGYNAELRHWEETEVGYRLRERGYRIVLVDIVMANHDYGITTLSALVRRFFQMGLTLGKILSLPPSSSLNDLRSRAVKTIIQSIIGTVIITALAVTGRWLFLLSLLLLVFAYTIIRFWDAGPPGARAQAICYHLLAYANRIIMGIGILFFYGRRAVLSLQPEKKSENR